MQVKFQGDPRKLAAVVVEAVTGENINVDQISCPCDVSMWRGKMVKWFCVPLSCGSYLLQYPNGYAAWPGIENAETLLMIANQKYGGLQWEVQSNA